MIQFLQPTGLWAMAGVVIPVIVHLWSDRKGKVLRVGSVALLTVASRRAAWSPRLTELLLLLLRCLLVMGLAVLLAGPYRMRRVTGGKDWVLVDASAAEVDTLLKAGYELHVMDSGVNYYEAFRRMDRLAPEDVRFLVFTPDLVSRFGGTRPVTDRRMDWELYSPVDSVTQWVEGVWRVSADSIMVLRGSSRSTGTEFRQERVASRAAVYAGVVVDTAALEVVIETGEGGAGRIGPDRGGADGTGADRIGPDRAGANGSGANGTRADRTGADGSEAGRIEGEYIRAALKALGEYTGRRLRVVASGTAGARVIRWQPEWSEAAWDGRLPAVLGRLLFDGSGRRDKDRRGIDLRQLEPQRGAAGSGILRRQQDLRPVIWAIVFALFILERILVFRRDKT